MVASNPTDTLHISEEENQRWPQVTPDTATLAPEDAVRFQLMVEHDPDAVIVVDPEFRVVYANPAARTMLGVRLMQQWRRRTSDMNRIHSEDLRRVERAVYAARKDGLTPTIDVRIEMPDGAWRWFDLTLCDLRTDPAFNGILVKLRDIDHIRRSEQALREEVETLKRQNQNKSAFLSTISHELRTPLTSIIGYSEFLAANPEDAVMVAGDAEVIHREATRLSRMVEDVLLMDRVDNGHISLNLEPLNVNDLVNDVTEAMRPQMVRHRLVLELDPALPRVLGDKDRLEQALTNLISNALKFSDHGGAITVRTARAGGNVEISVQDEGMGIAPEDQERIFQRFERVETGIAGRTIGTGLGLAIVKEIVNLHHGHVSVKSVIGEGSTFTISLPISGT